MFIAVYSFPKSAVVYTGESYTEATSRLVPGCIHAQAHTAAKARENVLEIAAKLPPYAPLPPAAEPTKPIPAIPANTCSKADCFHRTQAGFALCPQHWHERHDDDGQRPNSLALNPSIIRPRDLDPEVFLEYGEELEDELLLDDLEAAGMRDNAVRALEDAA